MAPQTEGAYTLYVKFLKPLLKAHQAEIENFIQNVQDQASSAADLAQQKAKEQMNNPENMAKAMSAAAKVNQSLN